MKERIRKYLKFNKITQNEFYATIGVSNAYMQSIRLSIQPDKLPRIKQAYPDINIEWLVTGRGNMLNTPQHISAINNGNNSGTIGNNVSVHTCSRCVANARPQRCRGNADICKGYEREDRRCNAKAV